MDWLQAIVLALVQGLTEFLPISSSAHLVLTSQWFGWPNQGLAFDVAVHVGTLLAVVGYFRKDWLRLAGGAWRSVASRQLDDDGRMAWLIALATVPAGLAGLALDDWMQLQLRSVTVIAWATIGFALLMAYADRRPNAGGGPGADAWGIADMNWRWALIIGAAQALALIPGTSRAGITITAALLLGFSRPAAARFSFLLAAPLIGAAGSLKGLELITAAQPAPWPQLAVATLLAGAVAWLCIRYFLRWINRIGLMPFVAYRLALGGALLVFL